MRPTVQMEECLVKHIGSHTQTAGGCVVSKWDYIITPVSPLNTEISSNVEISESSPLLQYLTLQEGADIMAQTDIVTLLSDGLF